MLNKIIFFKVLYKYFYKISIIKIFIKNYIIQIKKLSANFNDLFIAYSLKSTIFIK